MATKAATDYVRLNLPRKADRVTSVLRDGTTALYAEDKKRKFYWRLEWRSYHASTGPEMRGFWVPVANPFQPAEVPADAR